MTVWKGISGQLAAISGVNTEPPEMPSNPETTPTAAPAPDRATIFFVVLALPELSELLTEVVGCASCFLDIASRSGKTGARTNVKSPSAFLRYDALSK